MWWKCESIRAFCFPHCFLTYFLMTKLVYLIQKITSFFLSHIFATVISNLFLLLFFVVYTPIIVYHSYLFVNFIPKPVDKHSRLIYVVNLFNNNFNNFNKFLTVLKCSIDLDFESNVTVVVWIAVSMSLIFIVLLSSQD